MKLFFTRILMGLIILFIYLVIAGSIIGIIIGGFTYPKIIIPISVLIISYYIGWQIDKKYSR